LGIASLVIGIAGIATGKFESIYGSNAILAAVVVIIKGVVDLAAGVAGIKGANKPSQVDGAFKLGIVAAVATLVQAVLTLPALGGSAVNIGAFVIVVYDLFFIQQAHAVKAENKDRL
jgi:O-antigen ligase